MCIKLRIAQEEDCDLLFCWVNDELVRENAFNSKVISYEEHKNWFYKRINSDTTKIFIVTKHGEPIGQIRIDIDGDVGIIDYSIAKKFRGRGYGTKFLVDVISEIKVYNTGITTLLGRVKYTNIPSQKAFRKAGYIEDRKPEYIQYIKKLTD